MRQLPFPFLGLEGKSACRREKLVRGGRNPKKSEGKVEASLRLTGKVSLYGRKEPQGRKKSRGKGGSKLVTCRKSQLVGERRTSEAKKDGWIRACCWF